MNRLVLLRHGRTEGTERHLYYGATDLPLLEDGVQDLQLAAARGVYPSPDGFTFVTSGMLRANQTLRAIYGDVPFSVIDDLYTKSALIWPLRLTGFDSSLQIFMVYQPEITQSAFSAAMLEKIRAIHTQLSAAEAKRH